LLSLSTFVLQEVLLPDGSATLLPEVSSKWTVDQVKRHIFRVTPVLANLPLDLYALSVDRVAMLDETAQFVYSHPHLTQRLSVRSPAQLAVVSKMVRACASSVTLLFTGSTKAPLGRPRMESQTRANLTRSPTLFASKNPADQYANPDMAG
jgi:hypothetical protein